MVKYKVLAKGLDMVRRMKFRKLIYTMTPSLWWAWLVANLRLKKNKWPNIIRGYKKNWSR